MSEINPISSLNPLQATRWEDSPTAEDLPESNELLPAFQALDVSPMGLSSSVYESRRVLTAQVSTARTLMRDSSSDELMGLDLSAPRPGAPRPAPLSTGLSADDFMTNQAAAPGRQQAQPQPRPQPRPRPQPPQPPARPEPPVKGAPRHRPDSDFTENPRFKAMSGWQQRQLKTLMGMTKNRDELYALLESGKLEMRDSKEFSILDRLHTIANEQGIAPGINRQEILDTLIGHLAQPQRIMQGARGTCGGTSIQYKLALANPAEYCRIASGLIDGMDDKVQLQDGSYLERQQDSIGRDNSGRNQLDRLMQSSLMTRAGQLAQAGVPEDWRSRDNRRWADLTEKERTHIWYNEMSQAERDRYSRNRGPGARYDNKDDKIHWKDGDRDRAEGGLPMDGGTKVLDAATGAKHTLKNYKDSPAARAEFEKDFNRQYAGMLVSIRWDSGRDSSHALIVEGLQNGSVHLYNPHGPNASPNSPGPKREAAGVSRVSMSVNEFFSRLEAYAAE